MGKDEKKGTLRTEGLVHRLGCLIVLLPLLLLVSSPLTIWLFLEDSPWHIRVVDKTVPHPDYREHDALFWVFNHNRVISPVGTGHWVNNRDYLGYYPDRREAGYRQYEQDLTEDHLEHTDMLYIADTFGVYRGDYNDHRKNLTALDYSGRIYGGLSIQEALVIEDFAQSGGSLVGEYNTFGSPTTGEARWRLENLFGVRWTKWTGRYFENLGDVDDVPEWARRHWLQHYGTPWAFEGPGVLFTHEDTRLFVLQAEDDVAIDGVRFVDVVASDPLMSGVKDNVPFLYWFDVLETQPGTDVLASYQLRLTVRGRAKMEQFDVPMRFPAVLRVSQKPLRLYFAGDFSDNKLERGPYFIAGWDAFRRVSTFSENRHDQTAFFWHAYIPLLTNLLSTAPLAEQERTAARMTWQKAKPKDWKTEPSSLWRATVIDKTVPHPDHREHATLFWMLNHVKADSPKGRMAWDVRTDHIGYYPQATGSDKHSLGIDLKRDHLYNKNLLYVADTFGVYTGDYDTRRLFQTALDYSKRIYGGLDLNEVTNMQQFSNCGGSIVAEYNTFASPTAGEPRTRLEKLFGLQWDEWAGRFFMDLANIDDVPVWARRNYQKQYGHPWKFEGPGFLLSCEDDRIVVLEWKKDVGPNGLMILTPTPQDPQMKGVISKVAYKYWFDIVKPLPGTEVLANYQLDVTAEGKAKLDKFSIPAIFPAVLRASSQPLRLYFAGDFSDTPLDLGPYDRAIRPMSMESVRFDPTDLDQDVFFWKFYYPLLTDLLKGTKPSSLSMTCMESAASSVGGGSHDSEDPDFVDQVMQEVSLTDWIRMPDSQWDVQVIDKTVPHTNYREHSALFWLFNHAKVMPPYGLSPWANERDYIGFYPIDPPTREKRGEGVALSPNDLKGKNMLYIADTFGVYVGDYSPLDQFWTSLDYSGRIYGGFNATETGIITRFAAKGNAVVGEFNTFASPTGGRARQQLQNLFGLTWDEWTGRYFGDLASTVDVPVWARRNYEKQYGQPWAFKGPGFLFTHEDSRLFVLEQGKEVGSNGLLLVDVKVEDPLMAGVEDAVPFAFWFDVVTAAKDTEVLANFRLDVTAAGRAKMEQFGVPAVFPAVLRASRRPLRLYMAGDFSDNGLIRGPFTLRNWGYARRALGFANGSEDQSAFFWRFYVPMLNNLFQNTPVKEATR